MREELALFGGEKTAHEPFPPWPQFAEKTFTEVLEPLRSGRVGYWSGERAREFETRWAQWAGAPHAVCCASGTAALHVSLLALGITPGDEVIVPSHTFASTVLAVVHTGGEPVFCDTSEDGTLDPRRIEDLLTPRTRALVPVHLYGTVCAMDRIMDIARTRNLRVVEDCAQCVGGELAGKKVGTFGAAGCFSFSQGKHVSTGGEGGMIVCEEEAVARACRSLCDYGREMDAPQGREDCAPHVRVGFNYRMTELQAVIGLGELDRLDSWNLPRRRGYAKIYDHAFSQLSGVRSIPLNTAERRNAYWKYPLQLDLAKLAGDIEELRRALAAEGVPEAGTPSPQAYDEPALSRWARGRCETAEALRARTLLLGLPPSWERSHIEVCAAAVKKVLRAYRR
jgi:dTDP-4-amino-4,6-dideoxygalactose transaminase